MTPDELLRVYPRETLRWLRGRLGLSQEAFAAQVGVDPTTAARWEAGHAPIRRRGTRARLAALLAPHVATDEGAAFVQALERGAAPGAHKEGEGMP